MRNLVARFTERKIEAVYPIGLLCLAIFALASYRLDSPSLGFDEGFAVWIAKMPLRDAISYLSLDEHPPLHYILLHFWLKLTGDSEFALRFSSALAIIPVTALIYQVGKEVGGLRVGFIAALFAFPNALLVFYSHQARMYPLATTLSLLSIYLLLRTLRLERLHIFEWVALTVSIALSLYAVYYSIFPLLGGAAYVLVRLCQREKTLTDLCRALAPYAAVIAGTVLLLSPWIPAFVTQMTSAAIPTPAWRGFVPAPIMLGRALNTLALGHTAELLLGFWGLAPVAGLTIVAVAGFFSQITRLAICQRERAAFAAGAILLIVPIAAISALSYWKPIFNDRYVVVLAPAFILVLASLVTALRRSLILFGAAIAIAIAASGVSVYGFYLHPRHVFDDYRSMARFVDENLWPGDVILLTAGNAFPIFDYYFRHSVSWRGPLQQYAGQDHRRNDPRVIQVGSINEERTRFSYPDDIAQSPREAEYSLDGVASSASRLWIVRALDSITDPTDVVHRWAKRSLFELDHKWFAGPSSLQVGLYATRRPPARDVPAEVETAAAHFENGASIVAFSVSPARPLPGTTSVLSLYWSAARPMAEDFQVSVQLLDWAGRKVVQHDDGPISGLRPTSRWLPGEIVRDDHPVRLPVDMARPAIYRLVVGMYRLGKRELVPLRGRSGVDLAALSELVVGPKRRLASDADREPLAVIGSSIALDYYSIKPRPRPDDPLEVALVWRALADQASNYKVFVHLIDGKGNLISQQDEEPLQGAFPTRKWSVGDVIEDRHKLRVPAWVQPGEYNLAVGLYDEVTGTRLSVIGHPDGSLKLGPLQLQGAN